MHRCKICGYLYNEEDGDPDQGIEPGTPFDQIPDTWSCPVCSVPKEYFENV